MENLELVILNALCHNEQFLRQVIPHVKPEYFSGPHRIIYELILDFTIKYNKLPTSITLDIEYRNSDHINRNDRNEILEIIKSLAEPAAVDLEWLLNSSEKFCQDRAINLAIMKSVEIIDGNDKTLSNGAIPEILSKALFVSFDSSVGHSYINNSNDRYEFYHKKETKIPFDIDILNKITNGGVTKKTLNIILAGVHVGKSLGLCHMAAATLASGKNALYITMEMAEEMIAQRIDANLFDVSINDIENLSKNSFDSKIKGITSKSKGDLIIKEYPTGSAHVGHFRALIMELKQKKNFTPDIIFIDYMNICASSRIKGGLSGSVNTYSLVKSIAEEIRGLAVEFNVPIWTATQVTRCLSLDSIITMYNGTMKRLDELKLNDQLLSTDSKMVTVENIWHNDNTKLYEITLENGKTIKCSGNHIWPTDCGMKSIDSGLSVSDSLFCEQRKHLYK